jgi:hypothetical protein
VRQKFFFLFIFSLHELLQKAKSEGWRNVTDFTITLKEESVGVTELKNPGLRSQVQPKTIFLRILSNEFLQCVVDSLNSQLAAKGAHKPGPKGRFVIKDVVEYVAMILEVCGARHELWDEYMGDPNRIIGMTDSRYKQLRKHFNLNVNEMMTHFNAGLKNVVKVCMLFLLF